MTRVSLESAVLGPEKMQPWEISSRHRSGVEQNFWVVPEGSDSPRQPPAPSDVSFSVGVWFVGVGPAGLLSTAAVRPRSPE